MHKIIVAFVLLVAAAALAQERPNVSPGTKFPVEGQYKPSPQSDPTRIIALVPVALVPGAVNAKAPLFLEDRESPLTLESERVRTDSSRAEVPVGIISFRAMYSDDGEWALVALRARDAAGLARVREARDPRVRIFKTDELAQPEKAKSISLPKGLDLSLFLED